MTASLSIVWCDNSIVESPFIDGLLSLVDHVQNKEGVRLASVSHQVGNEIFRQRQSILDTWYDNEQSEWLLWLDSDVLVNKEAFDCLWRVGEPDLAPVVSGIYLGLKYQADTLPMPFPCIFKYDPISFDYKPIHPLPSDAVVPIDAAGMGFLLLHRNAIDALYRVYPKGNLFDVSLINNARSEDLSFFGKLKSLDIPVYAHTGAFVQHIKKMFIDSNYYQEWWTFHGE